MTVELLAGRICPEATSCLRVSELVAQIEGRLETLLGILLQAMPCDPTQVKGQIGLHFRHRRRIVPQQGRDHLCGVLAAEGPPAGGHLIEQDSEREDIGPLIDRLSFHLLWGHIRHRAHDESFLGQGPCRLVFASGHRAALVQLGQAEVEDLHPAFLVHHDVGRLEIPMGDALLVGGAQGIGQGNGDVEDPIQRQAASGTI